MARPFLILVISAFLLPCLARIATVRVEESGLSTVLIADDFGLAAGGYINFDVTATNEDRANGQNLTRNNIGYIVVVGEGTTAPWYTELIEKGDLDTDDPPPICVAPSIGRFEVSGSGSFNMSIAHHDVYSAYFMVCGGSMTFSGEVTSTFINLDPEGGLTQHLSIELAMLPAIYSVMAVVYVGMVGAWLGEMVRLHEHVLPIHFLCLLCVVVKMMKSILSAVYYHRQNEEGENQDRLRIAAVLFMQLFEVVLLLTLLLFSLGWGFIRQSLRFKEGSLVTLTVGLYASVSLVNATCEDSGTSWCSSISLMQHTIRSLLMLSTVVAINFNITHIRFCIQLPWTSSSALEYLKLSRYLSYRITFLVYLLVPTALLVVKITILSWEYEWIFNALQEFVTMLILTRLGTTFAPLDPWLLTRAFDHSLEQEA